MNRVIWVFGNAAVGKETFIRNLASRKARGTLFDLGLSNADFQIIEESTSWIAYEQDHPFREKRKTLPKVIATKAAENIDQNATLLIKGQFVDLENHSPEKLLQLLPNSEHHIIHLVAPAESIFERLKTKEWFKEDFTVERVRKLTLYEENLLGELDGKIPLHTVESGDDFTYRLH